MKLIIQNGSRVWGGNEKWLALLAAGLIARGHRVVVSCVGRGPVESRLRERDIPTCRIRPRGDLDVVSAWRFGRWLAAERPDALLLTTWRRLRWGIRAGRRTGVGRIAVRLGIVRPLPRRGPLARALRRDVDLWIVNAPEIREALLASAPALDPARVRLLLNGVPPMPETRATLRRELALPPEARLIAAAGHVAARKGFGVAVEALARLQDPNAHLIVAGAIAETDEARRLERLATSLGVETRVHLLGLRRDMPNVLASADVFVLTSHNEGMANVMLEAMAAGRPVVASRVSGVRTALAAGEGRPEAGRIVPPDDPDALAAALNDLLGDPAVAARMGAEARRRAGETFGVERMVTEAEAMLFG